MYMHKFIITIFLARYNNNAGVGGGSHALDTGFGGTGLNPGVGGGSHHLDQGFGGTNVGSYPGGR